LLKQVTAKNVGGVLDKCISDNVGSNEQLGR